MTCEDIQKIERTYSETKIQHTCVEWFRQTFPKVKNLLFAIPNGGKRTVKSGTMRKYEGAVSGISDLILLYPSGGKASLCIEMKIPKRKNRRAGEQSDMQKDWQNLVESYGSVYCVCHGLIEFIDNVCLYLKFDPRPYICDVLLNYAKYR